MDLTQIITPALQVLGVLIMNHLNIVCECYNFVPESLIFQQDKKLRIILFSYKDPQSLSTAEENLVKFGEFWVTFGKCW